jgi:hypothetical protein
MINEDVKAVIKEKIERSRREKALCESIESGPINEGIWDSLKNMIGSKDPEHSTKVSGTLKRAMDQAANKTVKNMFDQFEKDYPGFPNIKDSDKFDKGVTSLGLMYQSIKESALNGQMPVEVANSIVVTLKQYTEALLQDLSRTYKFFKEEEELEEVSAGKAALGGAAAGAAAMVPGVASAVGGAAASAATGYGGLLAGAAQGVGGLATWIAGGTAMTAGGLLGTLAMIGAPLAIGAGALMIGKRLLGSSRQGMLKKLVKMLDPVDPAKAAPYSGERASQASSVAQSVGQGNFKAATQGYTGMQNTYAQTGVQQLQSQPQVIEQVGGALEDAIGAENAAAFVAVASGKQKLEDLPELQQDIVRAVLGQFQTGDPEENIEDALEVAENESELEEEKEKLEDEGDPDATGGGEALPQETPLSITNSNAEQEEPLVAVIQDLGLPQDAAALIATKMVDYLNSREIPVSEGNLKRLASKIAVSLKEQMKVTDTRTSTRMKRPPVPDDEDPQPQTRIDPAQASAGGGGEGDPPNPNQVAQQAMAQRTAAAPAAGGPEAQGELSWADKADLVLDAAQLAGMTGIGAYIQTPAAIAALLFHGARGEWGKAAIDLIAALPAAGAYFKAAAVAGKAGKMAKTAVALDKAIKAGSGATKLAKIAQTAASTENLISAGMSALSPNHQKEIKDALTDTTKALEAAGMKKQAAELGSWTQQHITTSGTTSEPEPDRPSIEMPPPPEDPEAKARAGQSVEAGARERAQLAAGDSAIGKILVRAFEQAPEGDPLKSEEAIAIFSDPTKLKSLFDEVGLALRIQLQKRQYDPKQIDALLEHLLRKALLLEQADQRFGRWKELANI